MTKDLRSAYLLVMKEIKIRQDEDNFRIVGSGDKNVGKIQRKSR